MLLKFFSSVSSIFIESVKEAENVSLKAEKMKDQEKNKCLYTSDSQTVLATKIYVVVPIKFSTEMFKS